MATTHKYYAQKDALGFPIPGTMMSGPVVPKGANIIEISLDSSITSFDKPHPSGLRYFVSVDKKGNIVPNSLVSAFSYRGKVEIGRGSSLPSDSIEFDVNTIWGTWIGFSVRSTTEDFDYIINWGDGTTQEGYSGEGYLDLSHEYPESNTTYTARISFSKPAVIHNLDFYGFD